MRFTEAEIEFVKENYGEISYLEMSKILGVKHARVKSIGQKFCKNKIGIGTSKFSRTQIKYQCNDDYFEIPNEENSYWAGFIAADGCVSQLRETCQKKLAIALQGLDITHLEKFKTDIEFQGPILKGKTNYKYKGVVSVKDTCLVQVTSTKLCDDLFKNYNVTPKKSLTLKPPKNLSFENSIAFIKGYIDGDGWIQPKRDAQWASIISMLGTLEMVTWIRDIFEIILDKTLPPKCVSKRVGDKNTFCFNVSNVNGRGILIALGGVERGLERKWAGIVEEASVYKDPRIKFSIEDVEDIEIRLANGEKQYVIAKDYGVHQVTISQIHLKKKKWVNIVRDNKEVLAA